MSYYNRSNAANDRPQRTRTPRKEATGVEANTNGNNSNEHPRRLESYINNYTRSTEHSIRTGSRTSGGLRKKSNLVESMTATFEQLNKETLPPPSPSSLKSSSYNRFEAATAALPKSSNAPKLENGTTAPLSPRAPSSTTAPLSPKTALSSKADTPTKRENGTPTIKVDIDDEDAEKSSAQAKPSSSARRGRQQREKRMLRQKRRSTGVVRLTGSDEEKEKKEEDKNEKKDEEINRKSETEKNTVSNEFSPPPSANSVRPDSERSRPPYNRDSASCTSLLKSSLKSPTTSVSSQPSHSHQPSDNVFLSVDSSPQSPNVPTLNSSRRRGQRSSYEKSQQNTNEKREADELREKLTTAETTITNMAEEIQELKDRLDDFEKEKERLEVENKMLEDENSSMLRVLRQINNM